MLVFKLPNSLQLLIRISHWPVLPSVKLFYMCAQITWGLVLVYDSAGELARQPIRGKLCDQSAFSSEFEVGGAVFGEDIPRRASRRAQLAAVAVC